MGAHVPDHYRLLGVSTQAEPRALKDSYRRLSRIYHPDLQGGSQLATSRFQLISAAYTTLADELERERYDRLLLLTDPLRFVHDPRADKALDVLDGVVKRLRGRRNKALPGREKGRNLRVLRELDFATAALGGIVQVGASYRTACDDCGGAGTVEPARNPPCHVCGGDGRLKVGVRRQAQPCGFCDGRGQVLLAPCEPCMGRGEVQVERSIATDVPPRCRDGVILRVRGAGERAVPPSGAQRDGRAPGLPGDLLVEIRVRPDPLFAVEGDDVVVVVPISYSEAVLGASVPVPTLRGTERLRIDPGTPSGRELRIAGRGLPRRGGHGDMRYRVVVDVPNSLSASERAAVLALDEALASDRLARRAHYRERVTARETTTTTPNASESRDN